MTASISSESTQLETAQNSRRREEEADSLSHSSEAEKSEVIIAQEADDLTPQQKREVSGQKEEEFAEEMATADIERQSAKGPAPSISHKTAVLLFVG